MSLQHIADELVHSHQLAEHDLYLLNLVPIIELMWADGKVQPAETSLLYEYAISWVAHLSSEAGGEVIVSAEDVNRFILRFLEQRPDPALLARLSELALEWLNASPGLIRNNGRDRELIDYCLDITAAAVANYPYEKRERIVAAEKTLLLKLIQELGYSAHRAA
ncbi:MAG TPA: hypothetical protein VLC08_16425 [Chitinolyticbacter sp.]|nr:hypothetical protein [Chitinolyticbacter sp.]